MKASYCPKCPYAWHGFARPGATCPMDGAALTTSCCSSCAHGETCESQAEPQTSEGGARLAALIGGT